MLELAIDTEFARLRDVVLADISNFRVTDPVNETQRVYYASNPPELTHLISEQAAFAKALEGNGVVVRWAISLPECPLQVNTRDIAAVIGGQLVLGRMKYSIRDRELEGIQSIIEQAGDRVLAAPSQSVLEGGDIVVHRPTIFVGIGERTDSDGYKFVASSFNSEWEVIPMRLKPGILHLDTVFNILSDETALLYPDAFDNIPLAFFRDRFSDVLSVTDREQFDLATNVFALGPKRVIADVRNRRVNDALKQRGFDVIELEFSHTTRIGGSFRCATLPLSRELRASHATGHSAE